MDAPLASCGGEWGRFPAFSGLALTSEQQPPRRPYDASFPETNPPSGEALNGRLRHWGAQPPSRSGWGFGLTRGSVHFVRAGQSAWACLSEPGPHAHGRGGAPVPPGRWGWTGHLAPAGHRAAVRMEAYGRDHSRARAGTRRCRKNLAAFCPLEDVPLSHACSGHVRNRRTGLGRGPETRRPRVVLAHQIRVPVVLWPEQAAQPSTAPGPPRATGPCGRDISSPPAGAAIRHDCPQHDPSCPVRTRYAARHLGKQQTDVCLGLGEPRACGRGCVSPKDEDPHRGRDFIHSG